MTAATAALSPEPLPGSGPGATADDTDRADFRRWEREFAADPGCSHPIGLHSRTDMIDLTTGELAPLYGEVTVACGNRREAVCPSCSAVYKRDARQLVKAGLAGGKCCPSLKCPMKAAFRVPMWGCLKAPQPGWLRGLGGEGAAGCG